MGPKRASGEASKRKAAPASDSDERPTSSKKARSENWSKSEQLALVNAVTPVYAQIFGKHSNQLDESKKNDMWTKISDQVNAVSSCKRDVGTIKKKFIQLKSTTKGIASKILREKGITGGGESELPSMDDIMLNLVDLDLWQRSLVKMIEVEGVLGIEGGIDGPLQTILAGQPANENETGQVINTEFSTDRDRDNQAEAKYFETRKDKLTSSQASVAMITVQQQILEQVTSIAESMKQLVNVAKSLIPSQQEVVFIDNAHAQF